MQNNSDADMEGLRQTADFLRLSSGLVTGTIAFSFVFLNGSVSTTGASRTWIFVAWTLLFLSLILSIVVFMLIPPKFEAKDYTLYDPLLNVFGIAHLGTFVLGFIALAVGVGIFAFAQPPYDQDRIKTAQAAVARAIEKLPGKPAVVSVRSVELIKGTDPARSSFSTWRVNATVTYPSQKPSAFDVYLNAATGDISTVP